MSVNYIYEDLVIKNPKDFLEVVDTSSYAVKNDIIMLAYTGTGVTDSCQCTAKYVWAWATDPSYADTSILHLLAGTAVLTVGGDYSNRSNKYNLRITSENDRYETAAVRANGDLRLVLVAQTGSYGASNAKDKNIKIGTTVSVIRNPRNPLYSGYDPEGEYDPVYPDSIASDNQSTALGVAVAGTLVVSSDILGTINSEITSKLWGIRIAGDSPAVNTSVNQSASAIDIRAAKLTLLRNFTATITADNTTSIAGFASPTVTGNDLYSAGIRVFGDLTAEDGVWGGSISAKVSGSEYFADVDHVGPDKDGKRLAAASASMSNNDLGAYGLYVGGSVKISHLGGGAGTEISTASTNNSATMSAAGKDSDATIAFSNNDLSAYGIKASSATFEVVDNTFDIKTSVSNNSYAGNFESGKARTATLNNVTFTATGIDVATLTVGSFNGNISASVSKITMSMKGESLLIDDIAYSAKGINTTNLTASDNLGGTITVKCDSVTGFGNAKPYTTSSLTAAGIYNSNVMRVTGRINTDITLTMDNKTTMIGDNPKAFGIYAKALVADAFSGTISVRTSISGTTDGALPYSLKTNDVIESAGITVGAVSTATMVTTGVMDAFDINGDIYCTIAGVVSVSTANIRVSGSIKTKGIPSVNIDGMAITTDYGNVSSTNKDKIELADGAVIEGNIDLAGGENNLVVNSGAKVTGKLLATKGLMNIRFDLDETVQENNAIVTTEADDDPETQDDISVASTSTISINLNNAQDGKTYTLFSYNNDASAYWKNKQVTFSYQGQSTTLNVSTDGVAEATFTDAKGKKVYAKLTYAGTKVTVYTTNKCVLEKFGGELTTTFDSQKRTATLSWNKAVEAENYEVEYSIDGGKRIVVMVAGSKNSTVVNGIDPNTVVKWRVRGNTGDGSEVSAWSTWSDESSYAPAVLGAPKMSPATPRAVNPDEEGGGVTASRGRFTWEAATGDSEIAGYEAEFITSKDKLTEQQIKDIYANPSSIANDKDKKFFTKYTTATEVVATSLTNQSYVYWRVRAVDVNNKKSAFKDGESFRIWVGDSVKPTWRKLDDKETDAATAKVTYDRSDAYNVKIGVKFTWISAVDSQSGVKSYLLQYKRHSDEWFDETKVNSVTVSDDGRKTYSAELNNLDGDLYDYRIKAVDYVGNESAYLVTSQFGSADLIPPSGKFTSFNTPVVTGTWETIENTDEQGNKTEETVLTGVTVKLGWSDDFKDDSTIIYKVEVADNGDFLGKRVYSFETKEKSLTLDDSVGPAAAVLAGMSKVYYRVSVKDAKGNVNPVYSQVQDFNMADSSTGESIRFSPVAAAPTGLSVSKSKVLVGSSYRTNLTFRWADGDNKFGVFNYTLSLTSGGTTKNYTVSGNNITIAKQLDGNYTWKVTANTGSGSSASASGATFTVDATAPTFAAGASSSVSVVGRDFVINWSAATDKNGIAGYVLQYGAGTNTALWQTVTIGKDSSGKVATSYKGSISSSGNYNYRIYAVDAYGNNSSEAQSYIGKSFSIVAETHVTRNTARTITVTDARDRNKVAAVSANVGLSVGSDWSKFVIANGGTDAYITISGVASCYNSGSGVTVKVYAANSTKALSTISVASGDKKLQLRFSNKGTYYLEVTPKKSTSIMGYSVAVASDTPTAARRASDDNAWNSKDNAAGVKISSKNYNGKYRFAITSDATGKVAKKKLVSDYVGIGDSVDYRRLDIKTAGSYTLSLDGYATNLVFSIYSTKLDSKGNVASVKSVKKLTLAPKYDSKNKKWVATISTGSMLLDKGIYYFSVTAPDAKKSKDSAYDVYVSGTAYVKGNNTDDNWQKLSADYQKTVAADKGKADVALCVNEWAGFGDAVDYRKLTIKKAGRFNFTITGLSNAATLTVYSVNAKNKLVKIKSVSNAKSGAINNLLMNAGTYYVEVKANNAAAGKNTSYEAKLTGTVFTAGNNTDDNWKAKNLPTLAAGQKFTDWVGFGDKIDYRALKVASKGGFYSFKLSDVTNNVKITVYMKSGNNLKQVKTVTAKAKSTASTGDLCLKAGTYYLAVEAPGAAKAQNSNYTVNMTGKTFNHFGNETSGKATWRNATPANIGDGLLTTATGGDKIDYFDLSAVEKRLKLDAGQGKLKVSFYDKNNKAVKVAQVKMANGSYKKNVSSLTLVANDKVADNITLGSLSDSIRYMKIEAATNKVNTYKLSLIA